MQVTSPEPESTSDFIQIGIFIQGFSERLKKKILQLCVLTCIILREGLKLQPRSLPPKIFAITLLNVQLTNLPLGKPSHALLNIKLSRY